MSQPSTTTRRLCLPLLLGALLIGPMGTAASAQVVDDTVDGVTDSRGDDDAEDETEKTRGKPKKTGEKPGKTRGKPKKTEEGTTDEVPGAEGDDDAGDDQTDGEDNGDDANDGGVDGDSDTGVTDPSDTSGEDTSGGDTGDTSGEDTSGGDTGTSDTSGGDAGTGDTGTGDTSGGDTGTSTTGEAAVGKKGVDAVGRRGVGHQAAGTAPLPGVGPDQSMSLLASGDRSRTTQPTLHRVARTPALQAAPRNGYSQSQIARQPAGGDLAPPPSGVGAASAHQVPANAADPTPAGLILAAILLLALVSAAHARRAVTRLTPAPD